MLKKELTRRWRMEAKEVGLEIKYIVMDTLTEDQVKKSQVVKEFAESEIERTKSENDIISTREIWNRYDDWHRTKGYGTGTYIDSWREFGMQMSVLEYKNGKGRVNGKELRGFKGIRWNTDTTLVNDFMKKYTMRTDSPEDRIAVESLLKFYKMYCEQEDNPKKINETEFRNKLRKYDYKAKAAAEVPYIVKENGKKTRNPNATIKHCITKLKWLPGATEGLKEIE